MAEEAAAHHLLTVLEERDLNVDLDKVLATFEDENGKREAAAWVNEYLNEGTLLTREELELYQALKKRGVIQNYEDSDETIRPILDHELNFAIDSLESSTAAIEEQCKVLEAQRDALMALQALDKPNLSVEHLRNERRRKEHQEKARLDIAAEDVCTSLTEQLTDAQRDIDSDKSALKSYVTERLASDDKMLVALPGIVSKILTEVEACDDEKSIDQWCDAIISFRTAEIKARVDTVYLKGLQNNSPKELPRASEQELRELKDELQAELETLHSEIASVAEMVVEHENRKPMTEMKERKEREIVQARSAWLKYVLSTLDFMGKRLDTTTSHTEDIDEFQQALAHIKSAASQRETNPLSEDPASPSLKRTTSNNTKSAFSANIKLKQPKPVVQLPPVLQDALRHAGISYNQESIEALQETLVKTQLEREKKLANQYASASSSTHDKLAERFGKADADSRVIGHALYAHTPFSTVRLMDPELEKEMNITELEIQNAEIDVLNADTEALSLSDPRVRAFVGKYGK